jgi:hypothetical protein
LVIWLDTMGDGTAGSTYFDLEFTNLAAHACKLGGYPGVSAIGLGGSQVGLAAARTAAVTTPVLTLSPGATAIAMMQLTDTGNFPSTDCHQVMAAGLRVYPPGATSGKSIPYPFDACALAKEAYLHVRPMQTVVMPG